MTALTTTELTAMRSALEDLLPDTCIILTGTATANGAGEETVAWGTTTTGVKCRLDPIRGVESLAGGAIQPYQRMQLTVPYDTALTAAQQVKVGTISYNVVALMNNNSWALDLRAIVEKV